ncbi:hypothetical protein LZ554_000558 [Drepanopeziza brunnea f. sp. 'monogermtubi']|nr:hypothetical protein LZ554_000558 [Drepanopeziza brunnea f. sp. 'monogermtubi']
MLVPAVLSCNSRIRFRRASRRARPLEIRQFTMSSNSTIPTTEPSPSTSIVPDASTTTAEIATTPSPVTSSPEPSVPLPSSQIPATTPAGSSTAPTTTSPSGSESTPSTSIPATASTALTTDAPSSSSSMTPIISTITSTDAEGKTVTIVTTSTQSPVANSPSITATDSAASSSVTADLQGSGSGSSGGGLSNSGTIAVAVVVPIVAVALLIVAGLFLWRKRKARKDAEELRRKEVEEYGYNPNNDPTLPALGGAGSAGHDGSYEMKEDGSSGYRGWGTTAVASSGRKASTTVSGGHSAGGIDNALMMDGRPLSTDAEPLGAMGPAASGNRNGEINRGPSNASSSYSTAARSDGSAEGPGAGFYSNQYDTGNPYSADTQYGSPPAEMGGQPVIRDVQARRNTRIENPSHFPQQSAGISQNF